MTKRKKIDWESIEKEYRAGQLSIREISRKFNCAESGIRNKAKKLNWQRDLTKRVQDEVRNKLMRKDCAEAMREDDEIVDEASNRAVEVIMLHRKDASNLRELLAEVLNSFREHIDGEDKASQDYKNIGQFIKDGSLALYKLTEIERKAFNIDDKKPPSGAEGDPIHVDFDGLNVVLKRKDANTE